MLLINIVFLQTFIQTSSLRFSQQFSILYCVANTIKTCYLYIKAVLRYRLRTAVSGKSTVPASEFYSTTPQDFRSIPRFSHQVSVIRNRSRRRQPRCRRLHRTLFSVSCALLPLLLDARRSTLKVTRTSLYRGVESAVLDINSTRTTSYLTFSTSSPLIHILCIL